MKKILFLLAAAMMAVLPATAQKIEVVGAGVASATDLPKMERRLEEKYYATATVDSPTHTTYSNAEAVVTEGGPNALVES